MRPQAHDGDTVVATLALTALTLAAAAGMGRLFSDSSYLLPFAVAAVVAHTVMWVGRRREIGVGTNVALALGAVGLACAWVVLLDTTVLGLPGPATWRAAGDALDQAWADFATIVAPVPVRDGFLIAGMAGVGAAAVLADWAAFRMGVLFEAVLPSFTLFVFTAALGADHNRTLLVGLYIATLLGFLLAHQWGGRATTMSWFASRPAGGRGALFQGGALIGCLAVVAGVVVGPGLPGAQDPPVLALRDADRPGGGRRTTVSPLVDIRGRLVEQSEGEVFTVRSNVRSYWRLTSLDTFDGDIWSSDASYEPAESRLPAGIGDRPPAERAVQEFTIGSLSSIWLPATYRPERIEGVDDVSFNEDLGSLITDEDTTNGLTYRVQSAVPRITAAQLRRGADRPAAIDTGRFLRLDGVSDDVRELARAIARSSDGTPYGLARSLQDFFQQQGFVYDLDARPGHDGRALDTFLFGTRRGYCEQFAGAYGVLARLMGLPTRVAVGFTPGELGTDGLYRVKGLNAHAWPEVYLAGAGWVAFEPTPGRGAPGAEGYTGRPEAQAAPADPTTATTLDPTTTVAPAPGEEPADPAAVPEPDPALSGGAEPRPLRRHPLIRAAVATLALLASAALLVLAAKRLRRWRRRAGAATPDDLVLLAWSEAVEALAVAGAGRTRTETLAEHARRASVAARLGPEAFQALETLAVDAAAASYAPGPVGAPVAHRAVTASALVCTALRASTPWWRRALVAVDPRPLWSPEAGGAGEPGATGRRTAGAPTGPQ